MKRILFIISALGCFVLLGVSGVFAERIYWKTMSNGGNTDTLYSSTNYRVNGTFAQTAIDTGMSTNYKLNQGFWQVFDPNAIDCDCVPGDANGDGSINITDIIYLIQYKQYNGPAPTPYAICSGDVNCDCIVNILDITYLIAFKYQGGPAPCVCTGWVNNCGIPIVK